MKFTQLPPSLLQHAYCALHKAACLAVPPIEAALWSGTRGVVRPEEVRFLLVTGKEVGQNYVSIMQRWTEFPALNNVSANGFCNVYHFK